MVVRTSPGALDTLTALDAEVVFEFDERISEQVGGGGLETAFVLSPRSGELRVDHGRRTLSLRVEGGFRPGLVYRVTLNPDVSDLFGNVMTDPFELVFSTGGDPVPTTVAGEVWNRTTGQPVEGATVYATGPDSLVHQALTDEDGIFAFRYLPAGSFTVTAFQDLNRDTDVDSAEVQGAVPLEVAAGDTLLLDVAILQPDTSEARVTAATALDSVTVAVRFDDFLDPSVPASSIQVSLGREGGAAPNVTRVFHAGAYQEHVDAVVDSLTRLDSIAAEQAESVARPDTVPPDTVRIEADTAQVAAPVPTAAQQRRPRGPPGLPPLEGSRAGTTPAGRVLPGRRIVLLLSGPLTPEVEYEVRVADVVNIAGLAGGGGVSPLVLPVPDTVSTGDAIVPDTGAVDTTVVPDSSVVDTMTARRPGGEPRP